MPNKNYVQGRRKEYKIRTREIALGRIAFRSAGSHSPVDVVSIDTKDKIIRLIQAKPDTMSRNARYKIYKANQKLNGIYEVGFIIE